MSLDFFLYFSDPVSESLFLLLSFFQACKGRRTGNWGDTVKVSVNPHFSWSEARGGAEGGEKGDEERESCLLLAAVPAATCVVLGSSFPPPNPCVALFCCCLGFSMNRFIFLTLMWDITAVKQEERKHYIFKRVLFLFHCLFLMVFFVYFFMFYNSVQLWVAGASILQTIIQKEKKKKKKHPSLVS